MLNLCVKTSLNTHQRWCKILYTF